ncbi:phosphopentomutase [Vallitalea okinawensis]|uniref:phosphopentomutase n=1 Tax=Vallitalea okinawensis TaxID=2078660 RepID=UPI002FE6C06A
MNRVIWVILDSVGMGELPDADQFGDMGSNTIGNTAKAVGGLNIPNMIHLGLGNIDGMKNLDRTDAPKGCFARLGEISNGKDTTTGHWEMVGIHSTEPFPSYPNGFPADIIEEFEAKTNRKVLGNKPASGTAILDELGTEHVSTGNLIVYTSADSVFQIAAHEDVVPIDELYRICEIAREMLNDEHAVARVIARPFIGEEGNWQRTANRRDFSLQPPIDTVLDYMKAAGHQVTGVGKIEDIFANKGITDAIHTKDNMDGVDQTLEYMKKQEKGLIFTNLVDFDSKWGHRNNYVEYAKGLEAFDTRLKEITDQMTENDILFINADHGCDPTTPSTDHSREYVPLLIYGKSIKEGINLGTRKTFADIGQTIAEIFDVEKIAIGESFLEDIK